MDRQPSLSILIVTLNAWNDLVRCIESIRKSDFDDFEIIVVDNASTDDTVKNLRKYYSDVIVRYNEINCHGKGVNIGLGLVRGDYVLMLDPDTEVEPRVIGRLVEFLRSRADVSLVAPRTLNSDGSVQETARNFPSVINGIFGRQTWLSSVFPENRFTRRYLARDRLPETDPYQVEQVGAACMMFPRSVVEDAGYWDEGYTAYWVDSDWCMLLNRHGMKVYCVPDVHIVHHENNARGKKKSPYRIWLFHKSAHRFYTKWHTLGPLDPRALVAGTLLYARMAALILINAMKRSPRDEPRPRGETREPAPSD